MRDYNLIESAFLVFPILLSLSGLMFMSQRLQLDWYQTEREALGWIVVVLIFSSFLFFAVVFGYDIYRQAGCGRSATLRAELEATLEGKDKKSRSPSKGRKGKQSAGKAPAGSDLVGEPMAITDLEQNPMLAAPVHDEAGDSPSQADPGSARGLAALRAILGRDPSENPVADLEELKQAIADISRSGGAGASPERAMQLMEAQQAMLVLLGAANRRAALRAAARDESFGSNSTSLLMQRTKAEGSIHRRTGSSKSRKRPGAGTDSFQSPTHKVAKSLAARGREKRKQFSLSMVSQRD